MDLKVSSPESDPAALWIMKSFTFPMEITKEREQNLRIKMRNAELSLKGARVIYGLQQDSLK